VKISGPAVDDQNYGELSATQVLVANFAPAVTIATQATGIQIGYQEYDVADVTITENYTHSTDVAIQTGKQISLALGEYGEGKLTNYMYFAPVTRANIAINNDPSFVISDPTTANVTQYQGSWSHRVIEFTVMRKSAAGAEITLSNLQVNVPREVPEGKYDFLVGGSAVVDNYLNPTVNYLYAYDRFDVFGVAFPGYITVDTDGAARPVTNRVEIPMAHGIYEIKVNGATETLPVPLNVGDDNRLYVPLRFISDYLGVKDENIIFDDGSRKALIRTAEYPVTFTQDSPYYSIDGVEFKMIDDVTGEDMIAWIAPDTGRMYVPFSYLAKALNVPYIYDNVNNVVIMNPDATDTAVVAE
jgi:hypothetical protein